MRTIEWTQRAGSLANAVSASATVVAAPEWAAGLSKRARGEFPSTEVAEVALLDPETTSLAELEEALRRFATWSSAARLVLSFSNEVGASRLVSLLSGEREESRGWADDQVRALIDALGLRVVERHGARRPPTAPLAGATDEALRALFSQLNPAAQADWLLYVLAPVERPAAAVERALVPGLLSVVMRNHSTARLALVDQAVFSLAAQQYQPLEIVLVTQSTEAGAVEQFEALLRRHQPLGGYSWRVISQPSTTDIRAKLVNVGVEQARGQYLAILDDDDVVYPQHYTRLIEALAPSDRAWAFAPIQRAYFTQTAGNELFCMRKNPMPWSDRFDFARLAFDNYVTCHSYVIDRSRLGRFAPHFEERLDKGEDYTMLLRLLSLFQPLAIGGQPSAEYRIRDNGSNTIIHDTADQALAQRLRREWEAAIALKNALTDPLQMLISKKDFVLESHKGLRLEDEDPAPPALRYRLVDMANDLLKQRLGFLHRMIKSAAEPRLGPGDDRERPS